MAKFEPAPLSEDPFYEKKFKFPLLAQIEEYAEENNCSILKASKVVVPRYAADLPFRDKELFDSALQWQLDDLAENAPHSLLREIEDKPQGQGEGGKH